MTAYNLKLTLKNQSMTSTISKTNTISMKNMRTWAMQLLISQLLAEQTSWPNTTEGMRKSRVE